MKHRIALILVLSSLSASAFAISPCQEKEQDIQREISYAEKHHNQHRIDGLKKALSEVKAHCSDSQLKADHQKKSPNSRKKLPNVGTTCAKPNRKAKLTKSASVNVNLMKRSRN